MWVVDEAGADSEVTTKAKLMSRLSAGLLCRYTNWPSLVC